MLIERRNGKRGSLKDIVILYHGDCTDGFGGAWAAWKKFGASAEYIGLYRDSPLPAGLKDKELYFIDFLYEPRIMRKIVKDNKKVVGLDHHITNKDSFGPLAEGSVYSEKNSGAVLAWRYFHPKEMFPILLRYVEDRETWRWALPASKDLSVFMDTFAFNFQFWDKVAGEFEKNVFLKKYIEKGRLLKNYKDFVVKKLIPSAVTVKFAGYKILAVNAPHEFTS